MNFWALSLSLFLSLSLSHTPSYTRFAIYTIIFFRFPLFILFLDDFHSPYETVYSIKQLSFFFFLFNLSKWKTEIKNVKTFSQISIAAIASVMKMK